MDGPSVLPIERSLCYAFFHLRRATPTSPTIEPMPSSTSEDGSGTALSVIASDSEGPLWLTLTRAVVGVGTNPGKPGPSAKTPTMRRSRKLADCCTIEPLLAVNVP